MVYQASELLLALLFAIILGLRRINKTEILQYNGAFLEMLGLERLPDQTTLRPFLRGLTPTSIRQLARLHDSPKSSPKDWPWAEKPIKPDSLKFHANR
jgi:ribosomal protein L30/L7E